MDIFKRRKQEADKIIAYQEVFSGKHGELVLADLMHICGFTATAMGADPYETAFNEGKREIILRILNNINHDPEKILEILKDNRKEQL